MLMPLGTSAAKDAGCNRGGEEGADTSAPDEAATLAGCGACRITGTEEKPESRGARAESDVHDQRPLATEEPPAKVVVLPAGVKPAIGAAGRWVEAILLITVRGDTICEGAWLRTDDCERGVEQLDADHGGPASCAAAGRPPVALAETGVSATGVAPSGAVQPSAALSGEAGRSANGARERGLQWSG